MITLLGEHLLTTPELTGNWEYRLADIEHGEDERATLHRRHRRFTRATVAKIAELDKEKLRPSASSSACARAAAPRPARSSENSKAYGCTSWKSREEPGCGFVIWKRVAGRTLTRRDRDAS